MILVWSLLSLTLCFCFGLVCLHWCTSASIREVWLSGWPSVRVSLTFCVLWPCGMLCHLFFLPPRSVMSEFACAFALQEFCCCLGTCSLIHHGLRTLSTTFTNYLTWILLGLVAPAHSLGVMYLYLWENTFPFFPQGVFRVFVSGRYTSNQCQPITGLSKVCA